MIVLPGSGPATIAAAEAEAAAQQALVQRASEAVAAAAEVRRKAEDLSRRFVSEHGISAETPAIKAVEKSAAIGASSASRRQSVLAPEAQRSAPALATPIEVIVAPVDPLDAAYRKAAEAEARAAAERAARLAAEANAGEAIEQAAKALARAQEEAEAATRRAAAAEARALKAMLQAQRQLSKAAAATVSADKHRGVGRVSPAAGKAEPPQPVIGIGKPGSLAVAPKSALGAPVLGNATQPQKEQQAKSLFSPPSPPDLFGLVPSYAE